MGIYKLHEIKAEITGRYTSTFEEIDWLYGRSKAWGLSGAGISLWSGAQGVGKTRLLTQMMKGWDQLGWTSMICQGEISAQQFANEKMSGYQSKNILITDDMDIYKQISYIDEYSPIFMITDSVQQVEQYRSGRGAKEIVRELRKVLERTKTHVIFISQLTKDGKSKGGTELPHEVDIEAYLDRWASELCPELFYLQINKNRYGKSGEKAIFSHKDWGVECQSTERLKDPIWIKEHGGKLQMEKKRGLIGRMLWGE